MTTTDVEFLERNKYISLSTRKRSGEFVATPVWFAQDGDTYYVFTEHKAGKIKRLRNFSEVRIAPCNYPGKLTGATFESSARILEAPDEIAKANAALRKKYGLELSLINLLARITRSYHGRLFIGIDAAQPERKIASI